MTGRKILFVVDLQKDFITGSLTVPSAKSVIPWIERIKKNFDKVYFTLDWHPLNHCSFKDFGGPWPQHCVRYSEGASLSNEILSGLKQENICFIKKGQDATKEEYGALSSYDEQSNLFNSEDEVVVCGIAAEYCVMETLKNLVLLRNRIHFKLKVYLKGTAYFDSLEGLAKFMDENGIETFE